jgi:hypothetical protein
MLNKSLHLESAFRTIFIFVVFPDVYQKRDKDALAILTEGKEEIESKYKTTYKELYDDFYVVWVDKLNNPDGDPYISYIAQNWKSAKEDIEKKYEELGTSMPLYEEKILCLKTKYIKYYVDSRIEEKIDKLSFPLGNDTIIIDNLAMFHITFVHYVRLEFLGLPKRNKSIFDEHKDLHFIKEIEDICLIIGAYYSLSKQTEVLNCKMNTIYKRLILEKVSPNLYRVVSYFIIDKVTEIAKLEKDYIGKQITSTLIFFDKN